MTADLLLAVILVWGVIQGLRKGLLRQVCAIVAVLAGIWCAFRFAGQIEGWVTQATGMENHWVTVIAYILAFLIAVLLMHLVETLAEKALKLVMMGWLNKLLGGVFGLLKYAVLLSGLIYLIDKVNGVLHLIPEAALADSQLYHLLGGLLPSVFPSLAGTVPATDGLACISMLLQ